MRHALPQGNAVAAARHHNTAAPTLHQFDFSADCQPKREQAAAQAITAVNSDDAQTLADLWGIQL